jgi:hypothetical protein
MGANNADFQNHILVHRGVTGVSATQLLGSPRGVGKHWSSDEFIADTFADPSSSGSGHKKGTMISAYVHPDDVMTPDEVASWNDRRPRQWIFKPEEHEKEVPVRPGSTVHVVGTKTYTSLDGDYKEKKYKTPKQVKV